MKQYIRTFLLLMLCVGGMLKAKADDGTFYRLELGSGLGLGFGLTDANAKMFGHLGAAANLLVRFPLNPRMAVKLDAAYNSIYGNTAGMKDFYPAMMHETTTDRLQYKTRAAVYDLCGLYELHFLPYGYVKDFRNFHRIVPFMQLGLGATYSGESKAFTVNIPIGGGVKWKIGRRSNMAVDWTFHFTPHDNLEGLTMPHGIKSSEFRNKDHYSRLMVTFTYDLSPTCPTCNKAR